MVPVNVLSSRMLLTVESERTGLHKDVVAKLLAEAFNRYSNAASASSAMKSRETEEVSKDLKKMQDKGKKGKKYCMWTPQQRLEIGERAAKMEMPAHFDSCLQSIHI